MARIDWSTAWLEPGGRPGTVILTVDVHDASRAWAAEFNARAQRRFEQPANPLPWGSMIYIDGALIVSDLVPAHLDDLERYLARMWP